MEYDNCISLDQLISAVRLYNTNEEDIELIKKAYNYASFYHEGQKRASGEEYIIHPLNVAYILSEMHADRDTLCAALLHDTLEDTKATKEDIEHEFNKDVANLVDGVTNIKDLPYSIDKKDLYYANIRKIVMGLTKDVRIGIIKLADRLHNMRTLNYKKENKQKEKSQETMDIYVPLAYYIGAYRMKCELEDLAFKYLQPDDYYEIEEKRIIARDEFLPMVEKMGDEIREVLENKEIPNSIRIRTKNIYGIYRKICQKKKINDIHDLLALKVIVDSIWNCYGTLGIIHSKYKPVNGKFRDYISSPKPNKYQSLHTTLYAGERLVHTQIRTPDMDRISSYGLPALWDIKKGNIRRVFQRELEQNPILSSIAQVDSQSLTDKEFFDSLVYDVFSDKVYVNTPAGTVIFLPVGSTIHDYVRKVMPMEEKRVIGAKVNDEEVSLNHVLHNNERIKIELGEPDRELDDDWNYMLKPRGANQ